MINLDQKLKKEFEENVSYDEAELGCNWSMDDLWDWITSVYGKKVREEEKKKIEEEIDKIQKSCYRADGEIDGITALHVLREFLLGGEI